MFVVMFAFISMNASASEVIVSDQNVQLNVDISTTKVKLSQADYSSPVVKVLVPELADVTVLNHRNTSEGAPCMATYETLSPEEVVKDNPAIEKVNFNIKLIKNAVKTNDGKCTVFLEEHIEATIRGFLFEHFKSTTVGDRHIDDCR